MAEGDVVLPLCRTSLGVIPGLTGYLDSRSGSGMTAVVWLGMTVVNEVKNEARRYLEYEIEF